MSTKTNVMTLTEEERRNNGARVQYIYAYACGLGKQAAKCQMKTVEKLGSIVYRMPCVLPRADFPAGGLKRWSAGKDSERGRP